MIRQKTKEITWIIVLLPIFLITWISNGNAQSWDESANCNINVNDLSYLTPLRQECISSTVKLLLFESATSRWSCSGVIINRNTSDNDLCFYILTARHCTDGIDESLDHTIYCNYQSSDAENESTHNPNRGITDDQSHTLIDNDYEYRHRSQLRIVDEFLWGDLALIEVLTPIPPHFNISYAGWNPSRFINGIHDAVPPPPPPKTRMVGVHHPKGDIKKISGVNYLEWQENPVATGCYTITTIIDVLFGWIWGNTISTSVICNYMDNPWLVVPPFGFQYGIIENGSSGSGLFSQSNKVFGVLSGGFMGCDASLAATYGKLHANYSNASIKNTLNPNHNVWIDLTGLDGRRIDCYDNLELPGVEGVSGHYFPANHYQYDNKIILHANNNIETTQAITVYPDANYQFKAGNSIRLGPGFNVMDGATFSAKIESCNSNKSAINSIESQVLQQITEINLPKHKEFDINSYSNEEINFSSNGQIIIKTYPNPVSDLLKLSISVAKSLHSVNVDLLNINLNSIYSKSYAIQDVLEIEIKMNNYNSGVYILKISSGKLLITEKIIKI